MAELPVPRPKIISRLQKMEGQIRGIQNMVAQERDCVDILIQLSAAKAALESVAVLVLRNYTSICMAKRSGPEAGADLARAVAMWVGGKSRE